MDQFGNRLRFIRRSKNLTLKALADRAGMTLRGVQCIESGERKPNGMSVKLLAQALDVSADILLGLRPLTAEEAAALLKQ